MNFKEIKKLVLAEQEKSDGQFIPSVDVDSYLDKLNSNAEFIMHCTDGQCAGFVAFYCNDSIKKRAFITLVLLSGEYRGKGIASELIEYVLRVCKKRKFVFCDLEVNRDNLPAISLYVKNGFKVISELDNGNFLMSASLS